MPSFGGDILKVFAYLGVDSLVAVLLLPISIQYFLDSSFASA
jgi:hypothetical protein